MVRKIFICFFVLFLLTTLVVPAFATSSGATGDLIYPAVTIDSIEFMDGSSAGSVVDWPNNFGRRSQGALVTAPGCTFVCDRSSTGLETEVYSGNSRSVSIRLSDVFLLDGLSFSVSGGNDNVVFTRISYTFQSNMPGKNFSTQLYTISVNNYSGGGSLARVSDIDLVDTLAFEVTGSHDPIYPNGVLWLSNVYITIDFEVLDSVDTAFLDFSVGVTDIRNPFAYWFNRNKFIYGTVVQEYTSFPGMFDWLLNSVNAFLNFEIAPGLSLNTCFYIALVIGILIAFFKVFI